MQTQPRRILTSKETNLISGTTNAQRRVMESRGEFPERIQITPFRTGYYADEVARWVETRPRGKTTIATPKSPGRLGRRVPEAA
jgi:predicted DNA-binding transcriptional regulator AlpA